MGSSGNPPRASAGRPLPTKIENFTDDCQLNRAGKRLVAKMNSHVERKFGNFANLARHLARGGPGPVPAWARLVEGTTNHHSSARTRVSLHFGQSAGRLPFWRDIELILFECRATDDDKAEIASLWKESTGFEPEGYEGYFIDVSEKPLPVAESPLQQESFDSLLRKLEDCMSQNATLRAREEQLLTEKERLEQHVHSSDRRLENIEAQLHTQRGNLETDLRARAIPIPARTRFDNSEQLIEHNNRMIALLATGQDAQAANKMRRVFGARTYTAERIASELRTKLGTEQEHGEKNAHIAALLMTLAARPAAAMREWYQPDRIRSLSLPEEVHLLFELSKLKELSWQEPADRSLSIYLRTRLIFSYGAGMEIEDDPNGELRRLVTHGALPSPGTVEDFFESPDDVAEIRALFESIDADQDHFQRKIRLSTVSARRLRHRDHEPASDNAVTMIMPAWRSSA